MSQTVRMFSPVSKSKDSLQCVQYPLGTSINVIACGILQYIVKLRVFHVSLVMLLLQLLTFLRTVFIIKTTL